jgi:hypothetical protein
MVRDHAFALPRARIVPSSKPSVNVIRRVRRAVKPLKELHTHRVNKETPEIICFQLSQIFPSIVRICFAPKPAVTIAA